MSKALPERPEDKKFKVLAYVLGAAHLVMGLAKVASVPSMVQEWTVWAFPMWFMYFLGAAQLLAGACLFTRNLRLPASFAMALVMIGGLATAVAAGQVVNAVVCAIICVLCLLVAKHRLFQLADELAAEKAGLAT